MRLNESMNRLHFELTAIIEILPITISFSIIVFTLGRRATFGGQTCTA